MRNIPDTPKEDDPIFKQVSNVLIANNSIASNAANQKAMELGYNSMILSTQIDGEARQVGEMLADMAKKIVHHDDPIEKPAAIIIGGETTVTVNGHGKGGRNQELALAASMKILGLSCLIGTLGTDGIDGPTEAAGALVDGDTKSHAEEKGLNPAKYLDENDSYSFFQVLSDTIITGPTGTNVNDLALILAI